jgi:uncharacterized radical SAM protein YgiQ
MKDITDIPQTAYMSPDKPDIPSLIELASHEVCLKDKKRFAANFKHIEEESNKIHASHLCQAVGKRYLVVNPPYPPYSTEEIDEAFDLPYTRLPHPKYKGKTIPAYEMIKFSVCLHRGCFGGCAFCTISAHQGKHVVSRSEESVMREVRQVVKMPDFKGYLSDLGGPSANMYKMGGKDPELCAKCARPSCLAPKICANLNTDHQPLLSLYKKVDALPEIKKTFIGSGVRYDLCMAPTNDPAVEASHQEYMKELIVNHVSGRLKVAPEHTSPNVLRIMRKPSYEMFKKFKQIFDELNQRYQLKQQIIPYFISSHPGCTEEDMAELAVLTKQMNFKLEQVQDFTPTPMTLATEIYYSGIHPYTLQPIYTAKTKEEKLQQRDFFFWYKPEYRPKIQKTLRKIGRMDLWNKLIVNGHKKDY